MSKFIPLSVPNLKGNELQYVIEAIETEWVSTAGPFINDFERKIAEYTKSTGAVSCQNGTSGLHIALLLCGVTNNDEVIVPTLTFIAAVNPVKYIGAEPIFMDCDDSLTLDADKLLDFCQTECSFIDDQLINNKTKKHIKVVIVVHVFGNMTNMDKIMSIAQQFKLKVVEDATEAIGTYYTNGDYKGKYAGTIGTIGVFSFNGNKIITTGGGGMIISDDEDLLEKARHLTTQAKCNELYYIHDDIGYNYRMTNLQAALGLAQLEQLESFIATKRNNYKLYESQLNGYHGIMILKFRKDLRPNYWFYSLILSNEQKDARDSIIKGLQAKRIQTRPVWGLIHEQIPYKYNQTYKIKKARYYYERIINLPCSSNLTEEDVITVTEAIKRLI